MCVASLRGATVQDHVALVEIELCGELMIAASAAEGDRLSPDLIDEVLNVGQSGAGQSAERSCGVAGRGSARP
ncbi:hypothetical protein N4G70_20065 [Streptomyces sp. ASQP_92]|uniref:hypothetical protein n=1 Tax=unclassified Streptomyces TaxID=2593676 RepID=UPI0021C1031A|nr:hypothetical protein [Streptomyces sp. ASQP_92]MCT9091139.1 hypothetical protein [Streptomyces sp. ASQP_92]